MVGVLRVLAQLSQRRGRDLTPRARAVLLIALGCSACGGAQPEAAPVVRDARYAMGTLLEVTLVHAPESEARAALEACFELAASLEARFTTFDAESELSLLNAAAGGPPVPVSAPLYAILSDARRLSHRMSGAFDVTVGPLVRLWSEAAHADALPSREALAGARAAVGAHRIELTPGPHVRLPRGAAVDLGALAKGWALDRMGELLRERGIRNGLLSFGGSSVYARGSPPEGPTWNILVHGRDAAGVGVVSLRDQHLSVSESLGQTSTIAGERFGHVIDPRSGWPVRETRLAAVIAPTGAFAEAGSTALLILSPSALPRDRRGPGEAAVHALVLDGEGRRTTTPGFDAATGFRPAPSPSP